MNVYLIWLLQLNNLTLNTIILIFIFYFIFTLNNRLIIKITIVYSIVFKLKYLNFINIFIFGFFKVHILLFYIVLVIANFNILKYNYVDLKIKLNNSAYFMSISFFLGSLWSLHLFDWGYYWTNDSIEYVLLLFILFLIISIHKWKKNYYLPNVYVLLNMFILFMIRFNLIHTRHNFFQQNTLIYFIIKLFLIIVLQIFLFIKFNYKFFIKKFNILLIPLFLFFILIIINYINFFFLKLILYNIYTIIFCTTLLINRWGTIKYIYIHLIFFILYICFIVITVCYIFIFKFNLITNLTLNYNKYLYKHFLNFKSVNFNIFVNTLNQNLLFVKWAENFWTNNSLLIFYKKLINFII